MLKRFVKGETTYSILALVSLIGVSGIAISFTSNFLSAALVLLWLGMGLMGVLQGSTRTSIISAPLLLIALLLSGHLASVNSPYWVFNWVAIDLALTVFLLFFLHSLVFRDQTRTVRRSVSDRGTRVSATLARLDEKPPLIEVKKQPVETLGGRVKTLFKASVKTLEGWLGLSMPEEERALMEKERLKNYVRELQKTDTDLMEHLRLTTKSQRLKAQFTPIPILLHYILTGAVLSFLFLTPVWIHSFQIPPQILESIDILQPETILLASLMYCILTLTFIEANSRLQRLLKTRKASRQR